MVSAVESDVDDITWQNILHVSNMIAQRVVAIYLDQAYGIKVPPELMEFVDDNVKAAAEAVGRLDPLGTDSMLILATGVAGGPTNLTTLNVNHRSAKRTFEFRESDSHYQVRGIRVTAP